MITLFFSLENLVFQCFLLGDINYGISASAAADFSCKPKYSIRICSLFTYAKSNVVWIFVFFGLVVLADTTPVRLSNILHYNSFTKEDTWSSCSNCQTSKLRTSNLNGWSCNVTMAWTLVCHEPIAISKS